MGRVMLAGNLVEMFARMNAPLISVSGQSGKLRNRARPAPRVYDGRLSSIV